jgi:ribonuclease HII
MLKINFSGHDLEAGTDEAGRGCLAGPVFSAAVICPENNTEILQNLNHPLNMFFELINDSKKLNEITREKLRPIIENVAIGYAVTAIYPDVIDKINILNASILGMQESILKLFPNPKYVIIDGNAPLISKKGLFKEFSIKEKLFLENIQSTSIVKGDSKFYSIAAASILAKTYRDEYMNKIHEEFPMYNWKKNKGYPTLEHREAIKKNGITKYHRLSFKLLK